MKQPQKRIWNLNFQIKPNKDHSKEELMKLFHYTNLIPIGNDTLTEEDFQNRKDFPEMYSQLREIELELTKLR